MADASELNLLYSILRDAARGRRQVTYVDLAHQYNLHSGTSHGPRGVWDEPLGDLNRQLAETDQPPLSGVVVLKSTGEPGQDFWGSCGRVPSRPSDPVQRQSLYARILEEVFAHPWPETLPTGSAAHRVQEWDALLAPERPPLHLDADGVLRIAGTRVTLDTVVGAYLDGASAEEIALGYDALQLPDVHAALGFYLRHRPMVEAYLSRREAEIAQVRSQNQCRWPVGDVRERLMARRVRAS